MSAHLPPAPRFPEDGSLIGSWLVQERIGHGSHGVVFRVVRADQPDAGRYALKLAMRAGDERFEREAWMLSQVQSPWVPRLEDSGFWKSPEGEAHPYLVMQWVEGLSLYAWAAEYELTVRDALNQLAQIARALEATHAYGVHRDVKGSNVRVSPKGHAMLLDFGCCSYPSATALTGRAMPPGTNFYRSPQLLTLKFALELGSSGTYVVQPSDDVYALGITAYRLLAGVYPPRDSEGTARPEAPRGLNDVCPELGDLIVRMLAEDPDARGSAKQVAERLEQLRDSSRSVLDQLWVAKASRLSTEKARPPEPPSPARPERGPRIALVGGGLMLALFGVLLARGVDRSNPAYSEVEPEPPASGEPDAGTSVGNEALASVTPAETPPVSGRGIRQRVPDKPLPGQKRPPCNHRSALVINGGCWVPLPVGGEKAPCEEGDYEHGGRCYMPLLTNPVRVPTSDEPQ